MVAVEDLRELAARAGAVAPTLPLVATHVPGQAESKQGRYCLRAFFADQPSTSFVTDQSSSAKAIVPTSLALPDPPVGKSKPPLDVSEPP
jgi:hypothetical protein